MEQSTKEHRRLHRYPLARAATVVLESGTNAFRILLLDINELGFQFIVRGDAALRVEKTKQGKLYAKDEPDPANFSVEWSVLSTPDGQSAMFVGGAKFSESARPGFLHAAGMPSPRFEDFRIGPDPQPFIDYLTTDVWAAIVPPSKAVKNISRRMIALGANKVVVDHRYQDRSYMAEFTDVYHDVHQVSLYCKRLYFFDTNGHGDPEGELLGAVTLRPFGLHYGGAFQGDVGESRVTPAIASSGYHECDSYHALVAETPVYYEDRRLAFRSFPFTEQDALGSRCTHVAVQLCSQYLRRHLSLKELSFQDIRRVTEASEQVALPIAGLSIDGLRRALGEIGASPVVYCRNDLKDRWLDGDGAQRRLGGQDFLNVLHAYTDSQLPVVVVLRRRVGRRDIERHAVCVVGHTVRTAVKATYGAKWPSADSESWFRTTSQYLDTLLVHDDTVGPYLHLPIQDAFPARRTPAGYDQVWERSLSENGVLMAVPLPAGVHVPAEDALHAVGEILMNLSNGFYAARMSEVWRGADNRPAVAEVEGAIRERSWLVNVYLDLGKRVLSNLSMSYEPTDPLFTGALRNSDWPRYCWIAELSEEGAVDHYAQPMVVGHVVLDATTPWAAEYTVVALKLPHLAAARGDDFRKLTYYRGSSARVPRLIHSNFKECGWSQQGRRKVDA